MKKVHLEIDPYLGPEVDQIVDLLKARVKIVSASKAEAILVLGGDGAMHESIRRHHQFGIPFYGLNFGHVGFLLSRPTEETVDEILTGRVNQIRGRMLKAEVFDRKGNFVREILAFQDFYLERSRVATANIKVKVNGKIRFDPLICDGVIVASPAGSTAYNASAGGMIVPLDSKLMVLTGISPAVFHNWRSIQLPESSVVELEPLNTARRPVRMLADGIKIPKVARVVISCSDRFVTLGFAESENFQEKILSLQFRT